MSDPGMDDLLRIYRVAARETTTPAMDAHILQAAERAAHAPRRRRYLAWPMALAASLVLWAAWHPITPMLGSAITLPLPSAEALQLRHELQQVPAAPPGSDIAQYLLHDEVASRLPNQPEETP